MGVGAVVITVAAIIIWVFFIFRRQHLGYIREVDAKRETVKKTDSIFFVTHNISKKRHSVYDFFYDRAGQLTFFIESNAYVHAHDCKFDGFSIGGKELLAKKLNHVELLADRMDKLRAICNGIGLSDSEQDEIRAIIKSG